MYIHDGTGYEHVYYFFHTFCYFVVSKRSNSCDKVKANDCDRNLDK